MTVERTDGHTNDQRQTIIPSHCRVAGYTRSPGAINGQQKLRSACTVTHSDQGLCCLLTELNLTAEKNQTENVLLRLWR